MDPPADPGAEPMPERIVPMMAQLASCRATTTSWALRDQVGRRAGDRLLRGRARPAREPQPARRHLAVPGAARAGPRARLTRGRARRRDRRASTSDGPARLRAAPARACTSAPSAAVRRRMADTPVVYMIFDVLYLDGHSTMPLPYEERRELLERLELDGPHWQAPAYHVGDGAGDAARRATTRASRGWSPSASTAATSRAAQRRLAEGEEPPAPGVRGRRLAARQGRAAARRSARWRSATTTRRGDRSKYAGNVGTGFTEQTLTS